MPHGASTHTVLVSSATLARIQATTPHRVVRLDGGMAVCACCHVRSALGLARDLSRAQPVDHLAVESCLDSALVTFLLANRSATARPS